MGIRWTGTAAQAAGAAGALVLAGTMVAAYAHGPGGAQTAGNRGGEAHARSDRDDTYGIVNLAPPPVFRAFINARNQVGFEYTGRDDSPHVGFFDGQRLYNVDPPGALGSTLGGINDQGALAAHTLLPNLSTFQPFRWSAAAGPTFLPDPHPNADTFTTDINNRGQIVGFSQQVDLAARWVATNRLVPLQLPRGFTQSIANDINDSNIAVGAATAADGNGHAVLWDAAGRLTDLGTFGADSAFAGLINNRNEVAGFAITDNPDGAQTWRAFLWNRRDGTAFAGPPGSGSVFAALNERSEAVGRQLAPSVSRIRAFYFSRQRGFINLHLAPFIESSAADINDRGTIVGSMTRANPDGTETELAYRWSNFVPVDLNTRLINAPAGLVLTQALGISPSGDIVASSNAGLLLLRKGGARTDGPVLGPLTLNEPIRPTVATTLVQTFSDRNAHDTHRATVDWGDGSGVRPATVHEKKGRGQVSATHTYTGSGDFVIEVRVTDSTGKTTTTFRRVTVEPPRPDLGVGGASSAHAAGAAGRALGQQRALFGPETTRGFQAWVNRFLKK